MPKGTAQKKGAKVNVARSHGKKFQEEEKQARLKQEEVYFTQIEREHSWLSIRGCCKLLRVKCVRRWRKTKRAISQKIHNEIAATGAKKTTTYKTFRRMWRKKGGKGFRESAREWIKANLSKLLKRTGGKKYKKVKGSKNKGMFEKEMQAGCFGLSSFVIHNASKVSCSHFSTSGWRRDGLL